MILFAFKSFLPLPPGVLLHPHGQAPGEPGGQEGRGDGPVLRLRTGVLDGCRVAGGGGKAHLDTQSGAAG